MITAPGTIASHEPPRARARVTYAVAAVIAALAIAAPAAEASAATPHAALHRIASNQAAPPARTVIERSDGGRAVVVGPTIVGSVFNGNTTIITSPSPVVAGTRG
jgi:hypothetical protein